MNTNTATATATAAVNTHYWNKDVDNAIVEYRTTKSDKLFNEKILGPLTTLVESVYCRNGYVKWSVAEETDIKDCITHCVLAFDKFDSNIEVTTSGVIGFHYFTVIARNYFLQRLNQRKLLLERHTSLDAVVNDIEAEKILFSQIEKSKQLMDTADAHSIIDGWYDIFHEFIEWTKTAQLTEKDKLIIKHFVDVIQNDKCARVWKGGKHGITNMIYNAVMAENSSLWPMHTGTNCNKQVIRNYLKRLANKFLFEKSERQNDIKLRSSRLNVP